MVQKVLIPTDHGDIEVSFMDRRHQSELIHDAVVTINGKTIDRPAHLHLANDVHPTSFKIFEFYRHVHEGNFVIRSGFGACGCYGPSYQFNSPHNPHKPESDTEHAAGCALLLQCLRWFYPDLLSPDDYARAEILLRLHDIGENDIGDQMDDGSQDAATKDRDELSSFASAIAYLPPTVRARLIRDFIYFQNPLDTWIPNASIHCTQLARTIDKLEAILSGAIYEAKGAAGTLAHKNSHYGLLTERDRQSIQMTNSDSSIIATWLAQVILRCHTYYSFPYVLDIVKAAVFSIRGSWFPWFDDFCKQHQIPAEHVTHPDLSDAQQILPTYFQ